MSSFVPLPLALNKLVFKVNVCGPRTLIITHTSFKQVFILIQMMLNLVFNVNVCGPRYNFHRCFHVPKGKNPLYIIYTNGLNFEILI